MAKTIAAISTPLGEGGVGMIRISGEKAIEVADRCFQSVSGKKLQELSGYHAAFGRVVQQDAVIDEAVALVYRAPKSYTGEDVVEITVHGGRRMVREVLRVVLNCGAALAEAGEFTKRAFLNGKTDLARAESIMGLISAESDTALRISRAAHNGVLSRQLDDICAKLTKTAASLAVFADYPDEELPELSPENFSRLLQEIEQQIDHLLQTYDAGKVLREGIDCAIVGKPNVGKSTLMNLLSGSDRSIVTEVAGTTRDVIENTVRVGEVTLHLADTAGIHETTDKVEQVGVDRARQRIENAGLVLAVFDGFSPLEKEDRQILKELQGRHVIVILNKSDLGQKVQASEFAPFPVVEISAQKGDGFLKLQQKIAEVTKTAMLNPDTAILISERQHDCANRALLSVREAQNALQSGCTLDAVSVCVDDALASLLELTGKRVTNEVADEVFRSFCVGK